MTIRCALFHHDSDDPPICGPFLIKHLVAAFQIVLFSLSLGAIYFHTLQSEKIVFGLISLYMLISFVGFVTEQKRVMIVHSWINFVVLIAIVFFTGLVLVVWIESPYLDKRLKNLSAAGMLALLLILTAIFFLFLYYTLMCYQLAKAIRRKTCALPIYLTRADDSSDSSYSQPSFYFKSPF